MQPLLRPGEAQPSSRHGEERSYRVMVSQPLSRPGEVQPLPRNGQTRSAVTISLRPHCRG